LVLTKILVSTLFFVLALTYVFYETDFDIVLKNISLFSWKSILFLVVFNVLGLFLMAYRFIILLDKISLLESLRINTISMGVNQLSPARGGDILKPFMLKKVVESKLSYFFAIITIERFLDVLVLSAFALLILPIEKEFFYLFLLVILAFTWGAKAKNIKKTIKLLRLIKNKKVKHFLLRMLITLVGFNSRRLIKSLLLTITMYLFYLSTMYVFMDNYTSFELSFLNTLKVFVLTTLGLLVPSAPASLGTYEASAVFALQLFDITKEDAFSFALIYHFVQIITILSLTGLFILKKTKNS